MVCGITPFLTLSSDLLFRFPARGIPVPTCILPDTKGAITFLYLYALLPNIELSAL